MYTARALGPIIAPSTALCAARQRRAARTGDSAPPLPRRDATTTHHVGVLHHGAAAHPVVEVRGSLNCSVGIAWGWEGRGGVQRARSAGVQGGCQCRHRKSSFFPPGPPQPLAIPCGGARSTGACQPARVHSMCCAWCKAARLGAGGAELASQGSASQRSVCVGGGGARERMRMDASTQPSSRA